MNGARPRDETEACADHAASKSKERRFGSRLYCVGGWPRPHPQHPTDDETENEDDAGDR
jgi:hypothetical protein